MRRAADLLRARRGLRGRAALVALVLGTMLPALAARAADAGFMSSHEVESLGQGLYAFRYGPYRNIFLVGNDGVVVTDPLSVQAAAVLQAEISRLTDKPIRNVAYSHAHWDRAVGATAFKKSGATIVAQERCRTNIRETPHADLVEPDVVFRDHHEIDVGGASLELFHFGPSHGECLSVMLAKPANVLFVVDIANPPTGWYMEWDPTAPDTFFWNLVPTLEAIEDLARRRGVASFVGGRVLLPPGPGAKAVPAPAAGPVSAITERRVFWQTVVGAVRDEMAKGTIGELVASRLDRSPFEARIVDYDRDDMSILLRRLASFVYTGW